MDKPQLAILNNLEAKTDLPHSSAAVGLTAGTSGPCSTGHTEDAQCRLAPWWWAAGGAQHMDSAAEK